MRRRQFISSSLASLAAIGQPVATKSLRDAFASHPDLQQTIRIGEPLAQSNVPPVLRQGVFLPRQSVSALDISDDGRLVAVTTMAFRNEQNFWLISTEGKLLRSRYVLPWAPFQVAVLPGGAFGVGLAYSRLTAPYPTVWLFEGETSKDVPLEDVGGQLGCLRYGSGDWRRGWVTSIIGDLLVRNRECVFTVPAQNGAWQLSADGRHPYPLSQQRPFRMAASADGAFLALGYIAAEPAHLEEKTKRLLNVSSVVVALQRPEAAEAVWSAPPVWDSPLPAKLPDPADEFPLLASSFHMRPDVVIPFRVAASVAVDRESTTVAIVEYGGWLWVRAAAAIGNWDPPYHAIPFLSPQHGLLRIFESSGRETARARLPEEGLYDLHPEGQQGVIWCVPMKWFARGAAGCAWLPTHRRANTVHGYDVKRGSWQQAWQFPDAVNDVSVHPGGGPMLASCWDGRLYLVNGDGQVRSEIEVGAPAIVRWCGDGRFAVAGVAGEILRVESDGKLGWRVQLPAVQAEPSTEPLQPVFEGVPIYSVGRVGPEDAYVGDIWLLKLGREGILIDCGGSSSIPFTVAKIRAAGLEPAQVRYLMHTHSHGDHVGAGYLWRAMGLKIVAPQSAAYALSWVMPTLTDYGVWAPRPVDLPLPLKRPGDETEFTLCGLPIRGLFVPGHTVDSVIYMMELNGKRIAFTGDIGFENANDILNRCWGDREKAKSVIEVVQSKLIPWQPEFVFLGHQAMREGTQFLQGLVARSKQSLTK